METNNTQGSNKKTITILIILGVIVLCCILSAVGGILIMRSGMKYITEDMFTEDPAEVQQIASGIMDYDLPGGYQEQMAVNLFGMGDMVMMTHDDRGQVIAFLQFKAGIPMDEDQVRQQMLDSMQQQGNFELTYVGEWPATIRGQQVMVQEYEGVSDEGVPTRQLTTVFEGDSGKIFLMIIGADAGWDQTEIENFLGSID